MGGRTVVKCVANVCSCRGGTPATPTTSPNCHTNGADLCAVCQAGYHMKQNQCIRNQCTCENGVGTSGTECAAHHTENCDSCDPGFARTTGAIMQGTRRCVLKTDAFDCQAGYEKRMTGWSELKKDWCCLNEEVGCAYQNQSAHKACNPKFDKHFCEAIGCCEFHATNGCQSKVGDRVCKENKLLKLLASKHHGLCMATLDEDLVPFAGSAVRLQHCDQESFGESTGQAWTLLGNGQLQGENPSPVCLTVAEEAAKQVARTAACVAGDVKQLWAASNGRISTSDGLYCLTVKEGEVESAGADVILQACDKLSDTQVWTPPSTSTVTV